MNYAQISQNAALAVCRQDNAAVKPRAYLFNREDIAAVTVSDGVISAITLRIGAYAWLLELADKGLATGYSLKRGQYGNAGFLHNVAFKFTERQQEHKDYINTLKNSRIALVVENYGKNAETTFEAYGFDSAMTATAIDYNSTNSDGLTGEFTAETREDALESGLPVSVFVTSVTATRAMLEALLFVPGFYLDSSTLNSNAILV